MSQPKKDYYEILGIDRDADDDQITKAYRKLAMKWHPDRIKDADKKKEAEEKFKEITEANTVLMDPEKRRKYDQFGLLDGEGPDFGGPPPGFPDLSEIFGQMGGMPGMGGMGGMPGMGGFPFMGGFPGMGGMGMGGMNMGNGNVNKQSRSSQEYKVKIKLEEIFNGCDKQIEIPFEDVCGDCVGTGSKNKKKKVCSDCNGRGIRMMVRQLGPNMISQQQSPCQACEQKGWVSDGTCTGCGGKCTKSNKLTKTLHIKKNFDYQTKMCVREAGNYDSNSERKADIYISFKISDLEDYGLKLVNDYDLVLEHEINIWDAFSGYTFYYPNHPNKNKYAFKINEIIKSDEVKFVKKLGLPNDDDGDLKFGKLVIKFTYKYPKTVLTSEQLKNFLKEHNDTKGINKDEYIKEKLINPENDEDEKPRGRRSHSPDESEGNVSCAQS